MYPVVFLAPSQAQVGFPSKTPGFPERFGARKNSISAGTDCSAKLGIITRVRRKLSLLVAQWA
jgi:hypothetical protein